MASAAGLEKLEIHDGTVHNAGSRLISSDRLSKSDRYRTGYREVYSRSLAISNRERDSMTSIQQGEGGKDRKVVKCPKASWRRKRWSRTERTGILLAAKANQLLI